MRIILDGEEEHGSPNLDAIARAHRERLAADVLIGSDGPKQKNGPRWSWACAACSASTSSPTTASPASLHSGNYGNIVPNPVLPLARLIDDIEDARARVRATSNGAFRREASELFAKWEDRGGLEAVPVARP